jgi:alpha-tubulin suppressor-like RCC1 family protein
MVFEPQPQPRIIAALAEKAVTRLAVGYNHSVAVASDGGVWTWGNGGYGRLGHKVQQDEFRPRLVEVLTGRVMVPADAVVAAGQTSSFCTIVGGQVFAWGKLKPSGEPGAGQAGTAAGLGWGQRGWQGGGRGPGRPLLGG